MLIQNARSGKYLKITENGATQEYNGTTLELDIFADNEDPVNYAYSRNWMKNIPDDAYLSSVNIPGTHDSGTAAILLDVVAQVSPTSCQNYYYGEQLNVGVRSLNIRCKASSDDTSSASDVQIIHGGVPCYDRDGSNLTLDDILKDTTRFLEENPSEAVVMMIKTEKGSDEGIARSVGNFIRNNGSYVWQGDGVPSMGEARGKIVFLRRYAFGDYDPAADGLEAKVFGLNLNDWDDHDYTNYKYAINIYDDKNTGESVYVQDAYNKYSYGKKDYIEGTLKQTTGKDTSHPIPADAWIYNYTSCATGFPLGLTRDINPWLYDDSGSYIDNKRLGMVMMNFVDHQMSSLIYETNEKADFFETKAEFPDRISITYGQKLSEAVLGECSEGGTWQFEDPDYVPDYQDFENGTKFELTYTPNDSRLSSVTGEVAITGFSPKTIEGTIDNKEMTYGDDVPELTYQLDESQLVGDDEVADLDISLELNADTLKGGETYEIKGSCDNRNYDVQFRGGSLTVNKRTVGIQWSDTKNLVYTGKPVNVTAELTGIIEGDECTPVIEGGNEVNPSWDGTASEPVRYTARVTGLEGADAANYQLPADASVDYYIRRAGEDDFTFPEKAVLTYGQTLSEAELVGASGGGEFVFISRDNGKIENISNTMPAAGEYSYIVAYVPENTALEHAKTREITVIVNRKPVIAVAESKNKVYGDETPDLTFTFDKDQLAGEDTPESLGLTLTAGDGDNELCDAGDYVIGKKDCTNMNYDVAVIPALLEVKRKTAEVEWNGINSYTYSGSAVSVTAEVANKLQSDECELTVKNGSRTDAGSYTAVITGISNRNYCLPKDAAALSFSYEIKKADPAVTFPKSAVLTYGQILGQAELTGQSGEGSFEFSQSGIMPVVADSGNKYEMIFTPDDTRNYNTAKSNVPVEVSKKTLIINANDAEKIYSQVTPEFTWYMDETQLVGTDSADEFDLTLTAGAGDQKDCDAGIYGIQIDKINEQNENYDIILTGGSLTVDPLAAEVYWSSTVNIKVGDPAPSASIGNLVGSDDCTPVVESDGTSDSSWTTDSAELRIFEAEITGLSGKGKNNYILPDEDLTIKYLVRRMVADDYNMPAEAIMTYGEKLSDARMVLASGDGTFTFVDDKYQDISDKVPESAGKFQCKVKFTPDDKSKKPEYSDIEVTVKAKPVTANAVASEKIYGEKTELTFEIDESQLVGADTAEDLGVSLTAVNTEGEDEPDGNRIKSPAGSYIIQKDECSNKNYDVTVAPSFLWIHQRETELEWSDVSELYYTGEPVHVTADAIGLLPGDKCDVKVLNGDRTDVGTYEAVAVSLSNGNYRLPSDWHELIKEYTILEAEDAGDSDGNGGGSASGNGSGGDVDNGNNSENGPKTSDPAGMMLMIAMIMTAASASAAAAVIQRKKSAKR